MGKHVDWCHCGVFEQSHKVNEHDRPDLTTRVEARPPK